MNTDIIFLAVRLLTLVAIICQIYFALKGNYRVNNFFLIVVIALLLCSIILPMVLEESEPFISSFLSLINLLLLILGVVLLSRKNRMY
jgi:predicted membrane channel-forming protein YqfA (hemolysin III family)